MTSPAPEFLETGVPNLDRILGGGIPRRAAFMVIGPPGTGKTILAHQIVCQAASRGDTTLYLTGYSETHDKLLAHSRRLSFFLPDLIGKQIQLVSLSDLLRSSVEETGDAIVATARAQKASLVVLDGFRSMRGFMDEDHQAAAYFLYSLGAKLALMGATTLVVVEGDPDEAGRYGELTVCDTVVALRRDLQHSRHRRVLEVLKTRGATPLEGAHPFTLDHTGLTIFQRFETWATAVEPAWNPARAGFGVPGLDALIGGGLNVGTTTLMAGSPGIGKTLLGLHFIAEGARAQEPVLFLGFMESPAQLREKARVFGMDLGAAEAAGRARFLVLRSHDLEADEIATLVAEDVERRGVRRLVIDSAAEVQRSVGFEGRVPDFLSSLVSFLRGREVTTYLTLDVPMIVGPELQLSDTPLPVLAENLLLARHVEYHGSLHSVLSVLKMRFSAHERGIYEHTLTPGLGIQIVGPAPLGEGVLTGMPRVPEGPPAQGQA